MRQIIAVGGILLALIFSGCVTEDTGEGAQEEAESAADAIRDVLETQVEAWNEGSIGGFMAGYKRIDTLRFASGGNVWYGWNATEQRYQETYIDEGMMGQLSFSDLDIWPISEEYALVFGRWELDRSEMYESVGGLFTLLFELTPQGWRIVHDHTSAAETIESPQSDTASGGIESQLADTIDAQRENAQQ